MLKEGNGLQYSDYWQCLENEKIVNLKKIRLGSFQLPIFLDNRNRLFLFRFLLNVLREVFYCL